MNLTHKKGINTMIISLIVILGVSISLLVYLAMISPESPKVLKTRMETS